MQTQDPALQEAERLVASSAYGSADFARGLDSLRQAADAGSVAAQLTLGHVYSQVHLIPDAAQQAVAWYRRAAAQGDPLAQNRLADLHMIGLGVSQSDAAAFDLCRGLAERGYAVAQCNFAYMLMEGIGHEADAVGAASFYLRAAAQGEPRAYFNLGLMYAAGAGLRRDEALAWAWMENARRQRYPGSEAALRETEATLPAASRGEARSIAQRIETNFVGLQQRLAATPQVLSSAEDYRRMMEENFAVLGLDACDLEPARRPVSGPGLGPHAPAAPVRLAERPRVFSVDEFVSRSECAHLLTLAALDLKPAHKLTTDILSQENTAFDGKMAALRAVLCDAVVRNVERRVGAVFGLHASRVEPLTVLQYRGGQRYAPHVDYFDALRLADNLRNGDHAGQRVASFLVYLMPAEEGGETHYLKIGKKIAPRERMALCHYNCLPDGTPDPDTLHTGEPVVKGEKWLARTTLREGSFY